MTAFDQHTLTRRQMLYGLGGVATAGLVGSSLAACGSAGGSGTHVSAWVNHPEYRKAISSILAAFHKAHPDLAVDMSYKATGQYPTVLKTALVGGGAPDAIATGNAAMIWGDLGARGGYIEPLDGKIAVNALLPAARQAIEYQSHVWAAPVQMFRIGVYYQRSIFAQHGLSEPRSWDDLMAICQRLDDAGVTPWSMPAQDMILPFFFYHLAVNSILGPDGVKQFRAGTRKLTDPDLVRAAQYLIDMSKYYGKGFQAVAYAEGKALFARGRAAMVIAGSSDYAGFAEINPKLDVGFFGFPAPSGERNVTLEGLSIGYTVNKKGKNVAAATTFASWLTSEDAQRHVLTDLGLPSRAGIQPTGTDPRSTLLKAILRVQNTPSWLDYPEIVNVYPTLIKSGSGIFAGKLGAQQFAQLGQGVVTPGPAS
jgi:raffinose/stachyose/melibiose transport system substrate-binding protein